MAVQPAPDLTISRYQLTRARQFLARGHSLASVAKIVNCDPRTLDIMLWRTLGEAVQR